MCMKMYYMRAMMPMLAAEPKSCTSLFPTPFRQVRLRYGGRRLSVRGNNLVGFGLRGHQTQPRAGTKHREKTKN